MAIHVRSTQIARRRWERLRRQFRRLAAIVAIVLVFFSATILYLVRIFTPVAPMTQFTGYTEPGPKMDQMEESSSSSSSNAVNRVQVQVQPVIVTMADVDVSLAEVEISLDADLLAETDVSLDTGFETGDLGSGGRGLGDGDGNGDGSGRGRGRGKGGGGLGNNDDVQVVLVLDASGSMGYLFQAVAESLDELIGVLRQCDLNGAKARVNVGIVVYGQLRDNGNPWQLSPFSLETDKMKRDVAAVSCDGGDERCGEAIMYALKEYPWNMRNRSQMLKVIFIAGNESFSQGRISYRKAMSLAQEMGVIVNTIHCGGEDMEWKNAAKVGGGEGVIFQGNTGNAHSREQDERNRMHNLRVLAELPVLPIGSPEEQEKYMQEHGKRVPMPKTQDMTQLREWSRAHAGGLIQGYPWDAVEMCRRLGSNECTLDMLGGRGNLPASLRAKSDEQILEHIRDLADERQGLIKLVGSSADQGAFIDTLLNVLSRQAQQRGITITR